MRLFTLSKRDFLLLAFALLTLFFAIIVVGSTGPAIIQTNVVNSSYFTPPFSMERGPFTFLSPTLSSFNQELWLLSHVKVKRPDRSTTYGRNINISVVMFAIDRDGSGSSGLKSFTRARSLYCRDDDPSSPIISSGGELVQWCSPFVTLHLGYIDYAKMKLRIAFEGVESSLYPVQDVKFEFKTYDPTFSQFELWFRFAFVIITFGVTCAFAHVLRRYHLRNWTLEQKWMALILPVLLMANDPLFPLNFLYDSWIPGLFDKIFEATLVCVLLMFWLCAYGGVRTSRPNRRFLTFYLPKLVICLLLWASAVVLGGWQQYNELHDPTYNYKLDMQNFMKIRIFFYLMVAVYLLYLCCLLITAYVEIQSKPFFNVRVKFLTVLNTVLMTLCVSFAIVRFGKKILEDNFIASLTVSYNNSIEFVCLHGVVNLYIYALAFVYSPSNQDGSDVNEEDNEAEVDGDRTNILQPAVIAPALSQPPPPPPPPPTQKSVAVATPSSEQSPASPW